MTSSSNELINFRIRPGGSIQGVLRVPGDKSISHRSVLLGSLAHGRTRIKGLLRGDDVVSTMRAFRACGIEICNETDIVTIDGHGLHGLQAPKASIDCGNSGTAMRLLAGVFAGQLFASELIGDASLSQRPMRRIAEPLASMGARVLTSDDGTPPLKISPSQNLSPIEWRMNVASAQVKSAILLAGLYTSGTTGVFETLKTRDHTERMLVQFGVTVAQDGGWTRVTGGDVLQATEVEVPGDISSAAFFIVGALLDAQSDLIIKSVGINPTRTGLIEALKMMGGAIEVGNQRTFGNEQVADLRVLGKGALRGIDVPASLIPCMIDEIPILAVAAAFADGVTRLAGCEELRVKESDRIASVAAGLRSLDVRVEEKPDGLVIEGGKVGGGTVQSFSDHRIAMAFSIAGSRAAGDVLVHDCACVSTSFPGFVELATQAGVELVQSQGDRV